MLAKKMLLITTILSVLIHPLSAEPVDLNTLSGSWHLRVLDGNEVRKARAILDFNADKMFLSGFDGCNRITGKLIKNSQNNLSSTLAVTRMACRQNIHKYVSYRLHETIKEGFSIREESKYGVKGITLKSTKHELFFKRMTKNEKWF